MAEKEPLTFRTVEERNLWCRSVLALLKAGTTTPQYIADEIVLDYRKRSVPLPPDKDQPWYI